MKKKRTPRVTHLIALAYIEGAVDNGIHTGIRAGEEEQGLLNALVDFRRRHPIDPIPVTQKCLSSHIYILAHGVKRSSHSRLVRKKKEKSIRRGKKLTRGS